APIANLKGPSAVHLFGTDQFGRDILSRIIFGARLSFEVGFIAVGLAMLCGIPLGLTAGYYGRKADAVISILIDIMLAFPGILLPLRLPGFPGPRLSTRRMRGETGATPNTTRLVRGASLSAKQQAYVEAARVCGARNAAIMFRHILPNVLAPVIVLATLGIGG